MNGRRLFSVKVTRTLMVAATLGAAIIAVSGTVSAASSATSAKAKFCAGGYTDISYAGPMSGSEGNYGQEQHDGLALAVSTFNKAGGFKAGALKGCKVKILGPYDDGSNPSTGASIATQLATNSHLLAYFGNVDSGVSMVALPILAKAGIAMINSYSSAPLLTGSGFKNIFRVILNDNTQGSAIATLLVSSFKDKNLAVLWPDDTFGQGIDTAFMAAAKSLGANVLQNYSYPDGTTDFSTLVNSLKGSSVNGIALLGVYTGDAVAVKQLAAAGLAPSKSLVYIGNASDNTSDFVSIAGASAANGVYMTGLWNPGNANAAGKAFTTAFKKTYHSSPAEDAATIYDAFKVFQYGVEHGGTSRAALIKALHAINGAHPYVGITGSIGFDATGQAANLKPSLLQVVNGTIVAAKTP
jgi:branched-chain amino acid transport system substrate-binding protein